MNVTNSYTPGKTGLSGVKVWNDAGDQDGKRPGSITINLMKQVGEDGEVESAGKSVTLTADTGWTWSFTDLDEYENGAQIAYSVTEDEVAGYTTTIAADEVTGFVTITNSYKPETVDFAGTKTWADEDDQDGKRPDSITVRLLADGTEVRNATVTVAENWAYSFTGLPKYHDHGKAIVYTLTEDVNALSGDPSATSGGMVILLSLVTCGIYTWIWLYKQGDVLDRIKASRGIPSSNSGLVYLLLAFFGLGIVSYGLMQNEINNLVA
jgi:hypothetical protein